MSETNSPPEVETSDGLPEVLKVERVTLKKRGHLLPLGLPDAGGGLALDFEFKRWRGAQEREVGRLKAASKEKGDFVAQLLSFMCTKVGPHNFETMTPEAKQIIIGQMHMGDVMYMYVCLRVQALGPSVKMDLTCPRCNKEFKFDADLNSLEVRTAKTLEDVKWSYTLLDPFPLRGKEAVQFNMAPVRWAAMEASMLKMLETGDVNHGLAKLDVIRSSIRSVEGHGQMMLTDHELDELSKLDIETVVDLVDDREVGPDMSLEEKCPRCKRGFRTSLDWGYESFFTTSSPA